MKRRTRIKICGVTSIEIAREAVNAGADAIGLVFADGSPRRISIDAAAAIVAHVPPLVSVFGVFQLTAPVNPDLENWSHLGQWVQLHGDENEAQARTLSRRFRIVKGFRFDPAQIRRWEACQPVEMLVIDGARPGAGRGFRHEALAKVMPGTRKPILLAGGLTAENVGEAIRTVHPHAVDVSSGVETAPGVKSAAMIHAFCDAVRAADVVEHNAA